MELKVMSYNIASGRNLQGDRDIRYALSVICDEMPDVVGINELQHKTSISQGKCQAEQLAEALGWNSVFGAAIEYEGGHYGNALITRFPIISSEIIPVPDVMEKDMDETFESRCHLKCVVDIGGQAVTFLVAHYGLSQPEIAAAAAETVRLAKAETNPLIFMGDMNAEPENPLIQPVFQVLHDTAEGYEPSGLYTYPSDNPDIKIDYIFTTNSFQVNNVYVPATTNSDHRPYVVQLTF